MVLAFSSASLEASDNQVRYVAAGDISRPRVALAWSRWYFQCEVTELGDMRHSVFLFRWQSWYASGIILDLWRMARRSED